MRLLFYYLIIITVSFVFRQAIASENHGEEVNKKKVAPTLSLSESILLAVRSHPNVQESQLSYISQKFNTYVQAWEFFPHYTMTASAAFTRGRTAGELLPGSQNFSVQPGVSIVTPLGTQASLTAINNSTSHYNPGLSLQIMQPLLRGFGSAIIEAALNNAKDSEVISRLNIEGVLRTTVSAVINGYLDVISAERTITIDEEALKRADASVYQTQLFIKAGHKAGNELVTVEANVASAKSQLENDRNNLLQARYALLSAIGLNPTTNIRFSSLDLKALIARYHLPSLLETKQQVLENDIQYQIDQITLFGPTQRNVMVAEDNTRWILNFNANVATGNGSGGGTNAGINSIFNGVNQAQSIGIALQIPIDDQLAKQSVLNAKMALKSAKILLQKEKWEKETSAINGWNSVHSAERSLHFAMDAKMLQQKTYDLSYQKYLHGLIDSLELQSAQIQLIQSEQTLLSAQLNYIKSLVSLDLLTGKTLKTWDVKVRL